CQKIGDSPRPAHRVNPRRRPDRRERRRPIAESGGDASAAGALDDASRDERIGRPLMAEGRHRPMTGHEMSVVAHWPKALGDRIEPLLVIAAREVRSSDRSLQQYVADDRELRFGMVEHDMARRVARAMADVEGQVADRDSVAVDQIAVGLKWLAFYAVAMAVILQPGDPKQILLMRPFDRHSQFLRQN